MGEISDGKIKVVGVDVDSVSLTTSLRKKVGRASIESVEDVKEEEKPEEPPTVPKIDYPYPFYPHYPYPQYLLADF